MSTFSPGTPTGLVNLDTDYLTLQGNFTQIATSFAVDHVALTDGSGSPPGGINGAHKVVHLVPFSTTASNPPNNFPPTLPTAIASLGQLLGVQFNDGTATDQVLYYVSGSGNKWSLTRNFQPTNLSSGYNAFCGGSIVQWGTVSPIASSGSITFPLAFPNNIFNIQCTLISPSPTSNAQTISVRGTPSKTAFTYNYSGGSAYSSFYWMAIGA